MNQQNDAHPTAQASTGAPTRAGAIRRFFNAWRRWEKLMDYGPYDYTLDRIERLEREVERLKEEMRQSRDPGAVDAHSASPAALEH